MVGKGVVVYQGSEIPINCVDHICNYADIVINSNVFQDYFYSENLNKFLE